MRVWIVEDPAEAAMDGALFTLDWPQGKPSLSEAAHALKVEPSDLDGSFGVVLIDPTTNTYTVHCRSQASPSVSQDTGVEGPFSNAGIGMFGPPHGKSG
jgi:hypothetical protein